MRGALRLAVTAALAATTVGSPAAVSAAGAPGSRSDATKDTEHVVVTVGNTYIPSENFISQGDSLTHHSFDAEQHDLVSFDLRPDGQPWFQSPLIGAFENAPVPVEQLPPGTYPYYCSIHPFMLGTLRVDELEPPDPGDPEAPAVELPEPKEKGDIEIDTGDNFFAPETLTVPAGTTVSWKNVGAVGHTVTAADGSWDSHPLCPPSGECQRPGETYRRTFNEPGIIPYYCKLHGLPSGSGHAGTLVVVPPGEEQTSVGLGTSVSGDRVSVFGSVSFKGEAPVTVAADASGDGPPLSEETGIDLTGAAAYQPDPDIPSVFLEWRLADLPSNPPPEAVRYTMPFRIGDTAFQLQAKRSSLASTTSVEDPGGTLDHVGFAFQLRGNCADEPFAACEHLTWLTGSFDVEANLVRVKVPLGASPEIVPGAPIRRNQSSDPSLVRIRAAYETGIPVQAAADEAEWGDDAAFTYHIPNREVTIGIAPAGTPESEIVFDTPANVAGDGSSFSASLEAPDPGEWDVWVRACFGTNCGTTFRRTSV